MNWLIMALVTMLLLPAAVAAQQPDFFVSPRGDDRNAGSRQQPFASIERARDAVREHPDRTKRTLVVGIEPGQYFLEGPLGFGPEDSGAAGAPVVYTRIGRGEAVISGGRRLDASQFQQAPGGVWKLEIPEVAEGWNFSQLFVGGERRPRPRLPREGWYHVTGSAPPSANAEGKGHDSFLFRPGDINSNWYSLEDVEVLATLIWTMPRMRIREIDNQRHRVTFTGHTPAVVWWAEFPQGQRYLVENVREALGLPGQWYLDRKTNELLVIPKSGEDIRKAEVIAPVHEMLVAIRGDIPNRQWVEHIEFRGLTFSHTNQNTPPEGHNFPQAEINIPAAVFAEGARHLVFDGCRVVSVGGYAFELGRAASYCRIENCDMLDLGAGGVKIGMQGVIEEDQVNSHNSVYNNLIAGGGRMWPAAIGVWVGHASDTAITHNEITDFYYTGVSLGWSWGYNPTQSARNTVTFNHIHNIGQGVLSDMGGIYTLGLAPGSRLAGNRIHDINAYGYGGWGIYYDEGTTEMVAEDNLVYRTKTGSFHQHYGRDNIVRNNILAFSQDPQLARTRAEDHHSFTIERNIVIWDTGALLGSNWEGNNYKLDSNLYWRMGGKPFDFAGMSLEAWRAKGQDVNSVIADPLFEDALRGDFRLKRGSPAGQVGFRPFDLDRAGLVTRRSAPQLPRAFPEPPGPPPPTPVSEDFELYAPGEKPLGVILNEEREPFVIRVTDERAAVGSRSLKVQDGPGQQYNFNPHLFYRPGFREGVAQASFYLWVEPDSHPYHEWRDGQGSYRTGPAVWIGPGGQVSPGASRPVLMEIPLQQWVYFEITCKLGSRADGTWDLAITPQGGARREFRGLKCDSAFGSVDWFGFVSNHTAEAAFFLDGVRLDVKE